jgi:hypothetical protein
VSAPLWRPSPESVERAQISAFMREVAALRGAPLPDYAALYRWSIEEPGRFWSALWSFCGVVGTGPGPALGAGAGRMPYAEWFPEARLNFAENLLRRRIIDQIRRNATPRHAPARIVQIADIPRTRSGKIVELAVRNVVHGRPVGNREALANPEALDLYADLTELRH